ncbi:MAG: sodium:alanine symporter family protein [Chlamydiae bacterium]|nr:sodium:alanine symporter family protein [Chlamydiota bacterium]
MSFTQDQIVQILEKVDHVLWANFLVFFLVLVGVILTVKLKGMQFRYLGYSLKLAFTRSDDNAEGDISQFQSLMTALSATIGIGSIAGVATAIMSGGFGAIFWMWVIALVGMATKYAEAILAVKFRKVDKNGFMCGGPMYYIKAGLNWKVLAISFAVFGALSSFAGGNIIQANSIALALKNLTGISPHYSGIFLAILTASIVLGGIKSIGKVSAFFVPIMALFYVFGGLFILFVKAELIPSCLHQIFSCAFNGQAAVGGFLGAGVMAAVQMGVARGVSSNEAGLGSAPIAAAAAKTDVPGRQALISMTGVFLSSIIVCSITALVIGVTGVVGKTGGLGEPLNGAALVMEAFKTVIPQGDAIVAIGVILFGYSTIVGWAYYGEKCIEFIGGSKILFIYRIIFCFVVFLGSILSFHIVWPLADIMNGLMALPNLIALFALTPVVVKESAEFFDLLKREKLISKSKLASYVNK